MYFQFIKYGIIGGLSLLIDFLFYYSLTRIIPFFGSHLVEAKAISFFISSIFNFNFNKRWTFGKQSAYNIKELVKYYTVCLSALVVNALLMSFFLTIFPDIISWFNAAVITAIANFIVSRTWVFTEEKVNKKTRLNGKEVNS